MAELRITRIDIIYTTNDANLNDTGVTEAKPQRVIGATIARIIYRARGLKSIENILSCCDGCPYNGIAAPCIIQTVWIKAVLAHLPNPKGPVEGTTVIDLDESDYTLPDFRYAGCTFERN